MEVTLHLQMKENTISAAVSYNSADSSCPDIRSSVCWKVRLGYFNFYKEVEDNENSYTGLAAIWLH